MEKIKTAFIDHISTSGEITSVTLANERNQISSLPLSKNLSLFDVHEFLGCKVVVTIRNNEIIKIEKK